MYGDKLLRTGLIKRLEDLQKQYPACSWLKDVAELNEPGKIERKPRPDPLHPGKGTYDIYKSS